MNLGPLRILLVDDDPARLAQLGGLLEAGSGWAVQAAAGAAEGLEALAREPFDAVLADLKMPGMAGPALLQEVMARHPAVTRIILFEPGERDEALACLGWAHQFLAKPFDPAYLRTMLEGASAAAADVESGHVRELVARIGQLPAVPDLYRELTEALASEQGGSQQIGRIIAKDMAMTAMILKLANSAHFSLRTPVTSPAEATDFLGVELIQSLVLACGLFGQAATFRIPTFSINHLWAHSLAVANAARKIAGQESGSPDSPRGQACFTAGLLHDLGVLILASRFPEDYQRVLELTRAAGGDLEAAERSIFGACHGPVGAHLLSLWGLPPDLSSAAAYHHEPRRQPGGGLTTALTVHVADALHANTAEHELFATAHLDLAYLTELGLADRVPVWRAAAWS